MTATVRAVGLVNRKSEFMADFWAWAAVLAVTGDLCAVALDAESLKFTGGDIGTGCDAESTCRMMATALERWMRGPERLRAKLSYVNLLDDDFGFITSEQLDSTPAEGWLQLTSSKLEDWIAFLRSCGGFVLTARSQQ